MVQKISLLILVILLSYTCKEQEKKNSISSNVISIGMKERIFSSILNEEREIWVHVPQPFYGMNEQQVQYPVVYLMDGESQFISTVGVLDQLSSAASANDLCPQMIVVGIVNTNRNRDLTPTQAIIGRDSTSIDNTGGADLMAKFIEKELIPFIDKKYATTKHRTLIGHSLGGLFVLNTLIKFSHLFSNYLAIDPWMRWDEQQFSKYVLDELGKRDYRQKSLFIATANTSMPWMSLSDIPNDTTEIMSQMVSTLAFGEQLKSVSTNLSIQNKFYKNENHFQIPLLATYDGFRHFFSDHPFPEMLAYYHPHSPQNDIDLIEAIEVHYAKLSKKMGYQVLPMESYINAWAFGFAQFQQPALAKDLFELNIKNYPKSANVYAAKGYFYLSQKDSLNALDQFKQSVAIKETSTIINTILSLEKNFVKK